MTDLTLKAIDPSTVYDLDANTPLFYRFKGARAYMMQTAGCAKLHRFAEAMAECYLVPKSKGGD